MKKFLKALAALAAFALVSTSFIACSDDDDDGPSVVATYLYSYTGEGESDTETITFYDNKTFVYHSKEVEIDEGFSMITDIDVVTGTYTGNPAKDGKVKVKALKEVKDEEDMTAAEFAAIMAKAVEAAAKDATSFTFTNKDFPLVDIPTSKQEEEEVTITNGKLKMGDDEDSIEFTRQ